MEAQELRIGNYAMGNKPFAVDANHIAMAYNHEIAQNGHERFKSILLTEDWLKRAGFEWVDQLLLYADKLHEIIIDIDGFVFVPFCTNDSDCFIKIRYVHQLQNIIFALTGSELQLLPTP